MQYTKLGNSGISISRVGIGGHYKAMEEGSYEERSAYVDREVAARVNLVKRAIDSGINYFDTTWRNEVSMLAAILRQMDVRQQVVINGMVLGAFTGSKAAGLSVEDYFNKWLDVRLEVMPGGYFDTFMVNAIEEGFNHAECERVLKVLEVRKAAGDFKLAGFSCHDPFLARQIADRYPEFETVMVPYNYRNRKFEAAFEGYTGQAALIGMKSLIWLEYGIPFCAIHALPNFSDLFGFEPAADAAARALRFIRANSNISTVICAINSLEELETLVEGGEGPFTEADRQVLEQYNQAIDEANNVPLYLGALKYENLRMNYFGALHLSRILGVEMPAIPLNEPDSRDQIQAYATRLLETARSQGYDRYLAAAPV